MADIIVGQGGVTVYIVAVIFIATIVRSSLGFGEALIAVPLLVMRIPLAIAAPLAVMMSITIAACIVLQDWGKVHLRSVGWLLASTICGLPLGLVLLTCRHQQMVKFILALAIVLFAIYSLSRVRGMELSGDSKPWLIACGFFAGVMGGAFGMNGPPLAIYGMMRGWSPQHFRATLQGYFLPASLMGMGGFVSKGLWSHEFTHYYLLSLPAAIPAIWLGRLANHRLPVEQFRKYIYCGLIAIGLMLGLQAYRA